MMHGPRRLCLVDRNFRCPLRLILRYMLLLVLLVSVLCIIFSSILWKTFFTHLQHSSQTRNFEVLIWRHGRSIKRRFLRSYGNVERDPFEYCSVNNCFFSTNDSRINESDAVLFHMHMTEGPDTLPAFHPPTQVWIFFTDESPLHTFLFTRNNSMRDYDGFFNWSMTYRERSDVPVPYGRTVKLSLDDMKDYRNKNYAQTKRNGVTILVSNCDGSNNRFDYVLELKKHLHLDVYGACGNRTCSGHFDRDCDVIKDYKFYLAFENSNCDEYMTEKLWWNAYHNEVVPVVMGAPKSDYERLCPPNSFIHVSDFETPAHLARHLVSLMANDDAFNSLFEWKQQYKVLNEHGFFGAPSLHLCRLCEALNNGLYPKTYHDLASFWNPETNCY